MLPAPFCFAEKRLKEIEMRFKEQVIFRLTPAELSRLDDLAGLAKRTRSDLLRQLIRRAEVVPIDPKSIRIPEQGGIEERESNSD